MKKVISVLVFLYGQLQTANCQLNYWQQEVNYKIDVSLNDKEHSLNGFEKIEYINNSPDTLKFIWFHIWPNAYKNDKTAFSDQLLENGNTQFYFSDKEQKGYINRMDFKVNNITAETEDHPQHIDIIKLILPSSLSPGQKIFITTPFHIRLPYNFSRGGHDGQSYQVTQWYPKPAVYDRNGWHPMPYLDQGEFYSEFGSFDVSITVPENYVVGATGELQNEEEKEFLKSRSSFAWQPVKHKVKTKGGAIKTIVEQFPPSSTEIKILQFKQNNIHDFAWFADKRFIVNHDTCQLTSGKVIDVFTYYTPLHSGTWKNSVKNAKDAIHHYSKLVGEYPYNIISVAQGPESFGGGMEYPTITVISPTGNEKDLDNTIAHEIGHNWFYGILATNERDYPWMDEGINTFYDDKYYTARYGKQLQSGRIAFETKAVTKTDQPIETASEKFRGYNYGLVAYYKAGEWMRYLESQLGTEIFNKAMREYYRRWQFKHPQPEDFKKVMEESSGKNLDSVFSYLDKTGTLPNQQRAGTKTAFILDVKFYNEYLKSPSKNILLFGPSIGVNYYDKLMIGGLFTNLKLPPSDFQFFLAPMYATASKKFTGIGFADYTFYPNNFFRKIKLGLRGSTFTMDDYKGDAGRVYMSFQKLVPAIKLTVKEKNPSNTFNRFIQFKTFLISEDRLDFYRDTIINGTDTAILNKYRTLRENRTLNQLQIVIENYRALYPYRGELKIEQGKDFVRTAFTLNYFFNYAKEGGLDVRLFAGKFFYAGSKTSSKEFATDRYHLNMTGPNGYEDYTYSDYFIGRNEFEGTASQQIMVRDGAMKLRLEQFEGDPEFKSRVLSDNWLVAVNLNTSLPGKFIPQFIPLRIFADIGTSAGMWEKTNTYGKFYFVAGFQFSFLKNTINIYAPLLYSNEFKNLLKSDPTNNKFMKKISFNIDISNFSFRKFDRNFPL